MVWTSHSFYYKQRCYCLCPKYYGSRIRVGVSPNIVPTSSLTAHMLALPYSCVCLFDAIVEWHAMDERMFNDFLIGYWKWVLYVINPYLVHNLYFCICSGGIDHIKLKRLILIYELQKIHAFVCISQHCLVESGSIGK